MRARRSGLTGRSGSRSGLSKFVFHYFPCVFARIGFFVDHEILPDELSPDLPKNECALVIVSAVNASIDGGEMQVPERAVEAVFVMLGFLPLCRSGPYRAGNLGTFLE